MQPLVRLLPMDRDLNQSTVRTAAALQPASRDGSGEACKTRDQKAKKAHECLRHAERHLPF